MTKKSKLPDSYDEKEARVKEGGRTGRPRWLYVHELKKIIEPLNDDDWLTPNQVANLSIGRGEDSCIGIVDFYRNRLEWFNDEEE